MTKSTIALFIVLLFSPLAITQEHQAFTVPAHKSGPYFVIDVSVDKKPMTLLFDSGAAVSWATKRGIRSKLFASYRNGEISFYTIDDDASVAFIEPGIPMDGILGQDIMNKFSSVRLDYKKWIVVFEK